MAKLTPLLLVARELPQSYGEIQARARQGSVVRRENEREQAAAVAARSCQFLPCGYIPQLDCFSSLPLASVLPSEENAKQVTRP